VILCEKSDRLGGTLLCEEKIPFKKNLSVYLSRQALKVSRVPIDVRLNTEVTADIVESFKPDIIIAALGSRPMVPPIKGIDRNNVVGAEDVYYHPEIVGKNAVIMGGGLVGLELGIFLAQTGHNITVVEMAGGTIATPPVEGGTSDRMSGIMEMPLGFPLVHGVALREELKHLPNMKICVSTRAVEVSQAGLVVEDAAGTRTIGADTVIYAVGQKPLREEALALSSCAREFYAIGDCVTPKNIYEATSAAYQIAMDIGRF
jgi:pyruvate/2-oxoglutarate dehydrogenase complex dihydrolipoamide dehydrogenase (E3) component